MKRTIVAQTALALLVVLLTVMATTTVMSARQVNGSGLLAFFNRSKCRYTFQGSPGGLGITFTVRESSPVDESSLDDDQLLLTMALKNDEDSVELTDGIEAAIFFVAQHAQVSSITPDGSYALPVETMSSVTLQYIVVSNILMGEGEVTSEGDPPTPPPAPPLVTPPPVAPPPEEISEEVPPHIQIVVEFDGGNLIVTVPPGAIEVEGVLRIRLVPPEDWPFIPGDRSVFSSLYEIKVEADGQPVTQFNKPLRIEFVFDPGPVAGLKKEQVHVFYWDEMLKKWLPLPTDVDVGVGKARASTLHLTKMILMHDPGFPVLTDIAGHWAQAYVLKMAGLGVVEGYPDGTFRSERFVTRAEFAKMMTESLGVKPTATGALLFTDDIPLWAVPYIKAAVDSGLFEGYDDGTFRPNARITREEMAVVLSRAVGSGINRDYAVEFADSGEIASWARVHVEAIAGLGLMRGYEDGTFGPKKFATRAEACAVFWRTVDLLYRK